MRVTFRLLLKKRSIIHYHWTMISVSYTLSSKHYNSSAQNPFALPYHRVLAKHEMPVLSSSGVFLFLPPTSATETSTL
jgi:hypothetical protein